MSATANNKKNASGEKPGGEADHQSTTGPADQPTIYGKPNSVEIRMYCIGTGDCFIIKFFREDGSPFTMMIDCGSCIGTPAWFRPYVSDLAAHVHKHIDLLVVTHEHLDHVNGFQKCADIFEGISISNAWFAWTEQPGDPTGAAAELKKKRKEMKSALGKAFKQIKAQEKAFQASIASSPFALELNAARKSFLEGMDSLVKINLDEEEHKKTGSKTEKTGNKIDTTGRELAGMCMIKDMVVKKKANISYLSPGTTVRLPELKGVNFHVLGPPTDRAYIYKEGKEGRDVYRKNLDLNASSLLAKAFKRFEGMEEKQDIPFADEFVVIKTSLYDKPLHDLYRSTENAWRNIDQEWLLSAGMLAIRLTSHINNTSLALAIESERSKKVLMMPGDAEYGSWESWHLIKGWDKKGMDGQKHLVEDLLNRTAFYKVGHHLSYNGTALEKGIRMMPESNLVAMATLDLERISKGWKSTMPNKHILEDLIRRTGGRFFIMNEKDVNSAPSLTLDPSQLGKDVYETREREDGQATLYKQYTIDF